MNSTRRSQDTLSAGNLVLDHERREAYLGDEPLSLTYQEFEVLSVLLRQQNVIIPYTAICRLIWGKTGQPEIKRLGVVISNLRRKLRGLAPYTIESVRSRGYGMVLSEPRRANLPAPSARTTGPFTA